MPADTPLQPDTDTIELAQASFCERPVFVIGSPRSGTNILARSLAQHSDFWTSGESFVLWNLYGNDGHVDRALTDAGNIIAESWLKEEHVTRSEFLRFIGVGMNALFTSRSKGKRWIDHTPHYVLMTEVLSHMFPGALFLHILRDGRRVVNSMVNYHDCLVSGSEPSAIHQGFVPSWAKDFQAACRTWANYVEAGLDFEAQQPERCMKVLNERLLSDPETCFHEVLQFLGSRHEDAPARYCRENRLNSSFKNSRPAAADSEIIYNRWPEEVRSVFDNEAGATMQRCGLPAPR